MYKKKKKKDKKLNGLKISDKKNLKSHPVQPPQFTDQKTEVTPLAPQKTPRTKISTREQEILETSIRDEIRFTNI